jgi:hypothetical protein
MLLSDRPTNRAIILGALAIVLYPLLVVLTFYSSLHIAPVAASSNGIANAAQSLNETISQQQQVGSLKLPSFLNIRISLPLAPGFSFDFGDILLVAALVFAALFFARNLSILRVRAQLVEDEGDYDENRDLLIRRQKVASILDTTLMALHSSASHKAVVLECYRMISEMLEEIATIDAKTMTAREFRSQINKTLDFDSGNLTKLTHLFELALYSQYDITDQQAREASVCLENLSHELKNFQNKGNLAERLEKHSRYRR